MASKRAVQKFHKSRDIFFQKAVSKTYIKPSTHSANNDFFMRSSSSIPSNESGLKQLNKNNQMNEKKEKKPFDKKRWRTQKYNRKHKLEDWEDRRKKAIKGRYKKEVNQEARKFNVSKIYEEEEKRLQDEEDGEEDDAESTKKRKVFKKPHEQYFDKKEEKKRKREEFLKSKAEKEEALKKYKMKKLEKYKKLNKKTRHGQPIMKERMEYLLEKIQNSINA